MPELPEVETVRRGLARLIIGREVAAAQSIESPRSFPNSAADVEQFLVGAQVQAVRRRAKVLLIELSSGYSLVVHLKMTGQLVYRGTDNWGGGHPSDSLIGELPDRFTRAVITFTDNSALYFNDMRRFGWMRLLPTLEVPEIDFMKKVGPEPLEESFTGEVLFERLKRRKNTTIKAAILDQTVLAGVGNIYADESLWAVKLHPSTMVGTIPKAIIYSLASAIKSVMFLSLSHGGSTDKNYVDAEGNKGSYLVFANVFRREGLPCPRCGGKIVKLRVAGRGTHVCEQCQELNR